MTHPLRDRFLAAEAPEAAFQYYLAHRDQFPSQFFDVEFADVPMLRDYFKALEREYTAHQGRSVPSPASAIARENHSVLLRVLGLIVPLFVGVLLGMLFSAGFPDVVAKLLAFRPDAVFPHR